MRETASKSSVGSSIEFDDFLNRFYEGISLEFVQLTQPSNLMNSQRDVRKKTASKSSAGSSIGFDDFWKRSYEGNGLNIISWLKHEL